MQKASSNWESVRIQKVACDCAAYKSQPEVISVLIAIVAVDPAEVNSAQVATNRDGRLLGSVLQNLSENRNQSRPTPRRVVFGSVSGFNEKHTGANLAEILDRSFFIAECATDHFDESVA